MSVTSSDFPNRQTFVRREEFCLTVLKLKRTCSSRKRAFLDTKFPNVCKNIESVENRISEENGEGGGGVCKHSLEWDPPGMWNFSRDDADIKALEEDIFIYAKLNLAVVNVYIKDPVVTRIMRDQKIPIIAFVANTGGLLGLCMGFSLVSAFEVLFHVFSAIKRWWTGQISKGTGRLARSTAVVAERTLRRENGSTPALNSNGRLTTATTATEDDDLEAGAGQELLVLAEAAAKFEHIDADVVDAGETPLNDEDRSKESPAVRERLL